MRVSIGFHRSRILDWHGLAIRAREAERIVFAVWSAEAWSAEAWSDEAWVHDAVTPLAAAFRRDVGSR